MGRCAGVVRMVRCDVGVKGYWKQRTRAAVPQSDAAVGPAGNKKERLARVGPARRRARTCVLGVTVRVLGCVDRLGSTRGS